MDPEVPLTVKKEEAEPVKQEETSVKKEEEEAGPSGSAKAEDALGGKEEASVSIDPEDLLKEFFSDVRDVDRDNEVNRILWAFKLNPYEKLNLRFDAAIEDVKRQFRKLSLLVHPDKCKHAQASTAFEILGEAQKQLHNEDHRAFLAQVLESAREEIRKERKKATKHDSLVRVASLLNEAGRQGVEAAWEQTDEFHEKWKVKSREYLARTEWTKRKTIKRLKDEVAKSEQDHVEAKEKAKQQKLTDKQWETQREERVGTWRDFMSKSTAGEDGKGKKAVGVLKPPKLKTNDDDKLYVQRAVTEQFRPSAQPPQQKKPQQTKQRRD